jgi:hypothetical protein
MMVNATDAKFLELKEAVRGLLAEHSHGEIKRALEEILLEGPFIEVVISHDYGAHYGLSPEAFDWMLERGYKPNPNERRENFMPDRANPLTVECVKSMGKSAGRRSTSKHLEIVNVPARASWQIEEEDGLEYVEW